VPTIAKTWHGADRPWIVTRAVRITTRTEDQTMAEQATMAERETTPTTVAALAERVRGSRAAFDAAVARLTPEQFLATSDDDWSAKDVLAHVAAWEQGITAVMLGEPRAAAMGLSVDAAALEIDAVNGQIFDLHRGRPAADVVAMAREAHARMFAALVTLSDQDLGRHQRDEWSAADDEPLIHSIAADTHQHYDEHLPNIRNRAIGS